MNLIKVLQSKGVVRTAEGSQLVLSTEANGESRAPREVAGRADIVLGARRKRMGTESTASWEVYGRSCGASPSEGDLPGERPDTLQDQDLSADCPVPEAISETGPSGHAVLNGHSTAPLCPAAAAETSETTGHFLAPC